MSSPIFGKVETYILNDAPFAISLGEVVTNKNRPFVWLPNGLPFHVTDASELTATRPLKYRLYADRIEHFTHIFKEKITLTLNNTADANCDYLSCPVVPGNALDIASSDEDYTCQPCFPGGVDEPETVTDIVIEGSADEIAADTTVLRRSTSKRELLLEASSPLHWLSQ